MNTTAVVVLLALFLAIATWTSPFGMDGGSPDGGSQDGESLDGDFLDDDAARHPEADPAVLNGFREISPRHVDSAKGFLRTFHARCRATFRGRREDGVTAVRALFAARARVLQALHELRMRLPNDLALEKQVAAATEALDRDMMERIEDARRRGGARLVHPGPVDGAWYGSWYRASNDFVA